MPEEKSHKPIHETYFHLRRGIAAIATATGPPIFAYLLITFSTRY